MNMISLEIFLITINTILTLKYLHCSVTPYLFLKTNNSFIRNKISHILGLNVIHKIHYFLIILLVISSAAPMTFAGSGGDGSSDGVNLDYTEPEEEHVEEDLESEFKSIDYENLEKEIVYNTAIWLVNVGKIEKESSVYELDFYYIVESEDVNFLEVGPPVMTFMNSKTLKMDSEFTEEHYYEVRIRGIFFSVLDYSKFPFEETELKIIIEPDSPQFIENTILNASEELSGIDDALNIVGWNIKEPNFEVSPHEYENYGSFSRFTATFPIERSETGGLLKTFLPVLVITGISMLIFIIPGNYSSRIYLTAPLLLALVFLHQSSLGELPTLSYMTTFDKFMVIIYALFANSILTISLQMRYHDKGDEKMVKKINRVMIYVIPILVTILITLMSFI